MSEKYPDYEGEPLKLVEDSYRLCDDSQSARNDQYMRDYKLWSSFTDAAQRDPDRANIFIPKIFSLVETKAPKDTKALLGSRPYIPFTSRRGDYKEVARVQSDVLDELLYMSGFYDKVSSCVKMKTLYGTSFIEVIPYFEEFKQKRLVPKEVMGNNAGMQIIETPVTRLRFTLRDYAPWEIYVDPYATGLESKESCRYVIKVQLTSRRTLLKMAEKGAYPDLDIEELAYTDEKGVSGGTSDHWGMQMLSELGLTMPQSDDDLGILMRYESPDRYIDVWNGQVVLRDIPNPYNHGMINLSRIIHTSVPHTQSKLWGVGEAKPNEILQSMLNDTWNMTFDNHNMNNHGMTYYKKGSVNPDALVRTVGNKVAVDINDDKPIGHVIQESYGQALPQDHYVIPQTIERMMDLGSGSFNIQRGESDNVEKTLGEASMLRESGDLRQELNIRIGEHILLADVGRKALSHIDQFATPDDMVELVGSADASKLYTVNPNDLPGGFNFTFKGSDKVANMLIKQRNMKELTQIVLQSPNVSQYKWLTMLLETHEIESKDIKELLIPDKMAQQMKLAEEQRQYEREVLLMSLGAELQPKPVQQGQGQGQQRQGQGQQRQGQGQQRQGQGQQPEKRKITNTSEEAKQSGNEYNPLKQGV